MARKLTDLSESDERRRFMEVRKPYRKPVLESYGDIRQITTMPGKTFGAGDGFVLFTEDGDEIGPLKDFSG